MSVHHCSGDDTQKVALRGVNQVMLKDKAQSLPGTYTQARWNRSVNIVMFCIYSLCYGLGLRVRASSSMV